MGIGGVETGARDLARFMNNEGIQNYILSETNDKNFNDKNINYNNNNPMMKKKKK